MKMVKRTKIKTNEVVFIISLNPEELLTLRNIAYEFTLRAYNTDREMELAMQIKKEFNDVLNIKT